MLLVGGVDRRGGTPDAAPHALLRRASGLLDSEHPNHQAAPGPVRAHDARPQLAERDRRLLATQHPGSTDGRYRAACTHAERWGLTPPPGRSRSRTLKRPRQRPQRSAAVMRRNPRVRRAACHPRPYGRRMAPGELSGPYRSTRRSTPTATDGRPCN
jgi:hypothetical protein